MTTGSTLFPYALLLTPYRFFAPDLQSSKMDINLLVLNVGNSRLSMGVFVGGELQYSTRVAHALRGEWPARIVEAWDKIKGYDAPAVAAASVNPPLVEPLEHAVKQATGQ